MSTLNCHNWYELIEIVEFVDSRSAISDLCANNLVAYRVRPRCTKNRATVISALL